MTPPQETTIIQPALDQADEEDLAAIAAIYRFSSDGDRDRAIEAMRMALRRSRQRTPTTQPAPVEQDVEKVRAMVKRLRDMARSSSEAMRILAQAKSLRQDDNPERRIDLYAWPAWEETDEWKAADMIERLALSTLTPARAEGFKAGVEAAAKVLTAQAEACVKAFPEATEKWRFANASSVLFDAAAAIRALGSDDHG